MRALVLSPLFKIATLAVGVTAATVALSAAPPPRPVTPERPSGTTVATSNSRVRAGAGTSGTIIMGSAWTSANTPIAGAHVQLRNVVNGKIVANAIADEDGKFAFTDLESGSYDVELVNESGKILTVGHMFSIAPGESVATFVRLGAKAPWFVGFFGNASSAVTSAAASHGVTALAPVQLPLSAGTR